MSFVRRGEIDNLIREIEKLKKKNYPGGGSGGDMLKSVYDTDSDNIVDIAEETPLVKDTRFRIQQVDNDLWLTANAYWDGSNWQRIDTSKYAFAFQLQGYNNIPGESMQGVNLWRCSPGSNPIGDFGEVGGWEAVQLWTAYKDSVLGGYGLEIDGHGTFPYGRFIHMTNLSDGYIYTGILTNLFADLSGVDSSYDDSWFVGIAKYIDSGGSSFVIARASPESTTLTHILSIPAGGLSVTEDDLSLSDVGTGNVSTDEHGFCPKLPGDSTKFLNGVGGWAVPQFGGPAIMVGHTSFNPADSQTYYFGMGIYNVPSSDSSSFGIRAPRAGTVKYINLINTVGTTGSDEDVTIKIRKNGGAASTIGTVQWDSAVFSLYEDIDFSVSKDDYIELIYETPEFATNPQNVTAIGFLYIE